MGSTHGFPHGPDIGTPDIAFARRTSPGKSPGSSWSATAQAGVAGVGGAGCRGTADAWGVDKIQEDGPSLRLWRRFIPGFVLFLVWQDFWGVGPMRIPGPSMKPAGMNLTGAASVLRGQKVYQV